VLRRERAFSSFSRSFTLPENVDEDKITANLHNGVLSVNVPKVRTTHPQASSAGVGKRVLSRARGQAYLG
jgi:HSP20 family protein